MQVSHEVEKRHHGDMATDVRVGLTADQKWLHAKYFYDDLGSKLFDQICDLPEYYPTRTEFALLEQYADEIAALTGATQLFELGAGTARKTRILISAMLATNPAFCYVPLDISRGALDMAESNLRPEFPTLSIDGRVCDYTQDWPSVARSGPRLVAFLGSTIGNFDPDHSEAFLEAIQTHLDAGDWFLLGMDLVKDIDVLEAAYNDSKGITAAFNKNVLGVLNREMNADFDLDQFEHVAFFNRERSQIEMHLRALSPQHVRVRDIDLDVDIDRGETIFTEISRKFTREGAEQMFAQAGFRLEHWFTPENEYFGLALARKED